MALVPWPEDAALQHEAGTLLSVAVFGSNTSENRAKSVRLGPVAAALVDSYAPLAPIPVQDECVFRIVGWMAEKGLNTTFTAGSVTVRKSRGRDELSALKYSGCGCSAQSLEAATGGQGDGISGPCYSSGSPEST